MLPGSKRSCLTAYSAFSQGWFAMPQLVLQADWQDVWHSPQPPLLTLSAMSRVSKVSMCFKGRHSFYFISSLRMPHFIVFVKPCGSPMSLAPLVFSACSARRKSSPTRSPGTISGTPGG